MAGHGLGPSLFPQPTWPTFFWTICGPPFQALFPGRGQPSDWRYQGQPRRCANLSATRYGRSSKIFKAKIGLSDRPLLNPAVENLIFLTIDSHHWGYKWFSDKPKWRCPDMGIIPKIIYLIFGVSIINNLFGGIPHLKEKTQAMWIKQCHKPSPASPFL